ARHRGRLRSLCGRPERRTRRVFRPLRRGGAGRPGAVYPAAAEHAGTDYPGGPLRLRHRLRLSRRGRADGGGPVRRCHRLCPHGDGGIWLRPGVPGAGEGQDLRPADGRG
ncbi:PadR family transcriptional regulator, partial [Dysosmobacter welbionis]